MRKIWILGWMLLLASCGSETGTDKRIQSDLGGTNEINNGRDEGFDTRYHGVVSISTGTLYKTEYDKDLNVLSDTRLRPKDASITPKDLHYCTGSLIGSRHVLTAGHCVKHVKERKNIFQIVEGYDAYEHAGYTVVSGLYDIEKYLEIRDQRFLTATSIGAKLHPEFAKNVNIRNIGQNGGLLPLYPDMAIIQLSNSISNAKVTLRIIESEAVALSMQNFVAAGWGLNELGETPAMLQSLGFSVTGVQNFETPFQAFRYVDLQASGNRSSSGAFNQGDSGSGPLYQNNSYLVGVVSSKGTYNGVDQAFTLITPAIAQVDSNVMVRVTRSSSFDTLILNSLAVQRARARRSRRRVGRADVT